MASNRDLFGNTAPDMTDKSARRPLIDPLLLLLKSRRVLVALSTLLLGLITLALAVIGGYSLEDAARAGRTTQSPPPDELRDLIKDVLMDVVNDTSPKS